MVRKVGIGIFIAIFVIFLMSHNANALTPVLDLNNYESIIRGGIYNNECSFTGGSNIVSGTTNACAVTVTTSATRLNSITTVGTFDVKEGDILNFFLIVSSANNNYFIAPPVWTQFGGGIGWDVVGFQEVSKDDYIYKTLGTNTLNPEGIDTTILNGVSRIYEFTMRANQAGNLKLGLSSSSGILSLSTIDNSMRVSFSARNFSIYRYTGSEENKEQQEKTQEAVDQSTSDGNSSQNTVESSTQSLMSAGGSIISALVNAQATDCNINVQTTGSSRLFTTAIGQLNLCSDVPQGVLTMVQGIVALVFTPIVLYFTYNVLTTLYNQFKEYNS